MATHFFKKDKKTAFEAKVMAQWIAFGPAIFQAARVMRDSGILQVIDESGKEGLTVEDIAGKVKLSIYGVRVLIESALGSGLILVNDDRYTLAKTGYFILHDQMTKVNMDFVHDIYYKGLYSLDKSIASGKPEGLKEFGKWNTVYEGLSQLPEKAKESWFNFDHFFSDDVFNEVLPMVYNSGVKRLLDIGGNTGKWAIASARFRDDIEVTIADLPGQIGMASEKIAAAGFSDRVSFFETNILNDSISLPRGYDAIWMSQFLDCFSETEMVSILKRCADALDENGTVFILEPIWDMQQFEAAAFCLQQTSLYFTTVANGNSQLYSMEVYRNCIKKAGFYIAEQTDHIGLSQSLLKCKKITESEK